MFYRDGEPGSGFTWTRRLCGLSIGYDPDNPLTGLAAVLLRVIDYTHCNGISNVLLQPDSYLQFCGPLRVHLKLHRPSS